MEDKELTIKNIPYGYPLCFNDECAKKEKCMHYQARLLKLDGRLQGSAVYPTAWQDGECNTDPPTASPSTTTKRTGISGK